MYHNKVSVLMSVYQKEKAEYLKWSIKSILVDQTQQPDEFVLVCDGPLTPELDDVIEEYKKNYPGIFVVYRTEKNQGLGKALNYGLSKCSYEIIIRADSDDICVPDRIKTQNDYLEKNPDVAVVSSWIDEFDQDWNKPKNVKKLPLKSDELAKMATFRNPINHMAAAFRKEVILSVGSYQHIPYIEDYELWVRTIVNGYKLGNIDRVLVHARVGNGMIRRRGNKQYISSWKKLNIYMLKHGMINRFKFLRNMGAVVVFVCLPGGMKELLYKGLLRE